MAYSFLVSQNSAGQPNKRKVELTFRECLLVTNALKLFLHLMITTDIYTRYYQFILQMMT